MLNGYADEGGGEERMAPGLNPAIRRLAALVALALVATACGRGGGAGRAPPPGQPSGQVIMYTSVTQDTVDAVLNAYKARQPGVSVKVFRAPTGQLNARIAADRRAGGVKADVIWHTDPLSMQQHAAAGLLRRWVPAEASKIPGPYKSDTAWGTRILNMVIVYRPELEPVPVSWSDLTNPAYRGAVAIPDPAFAGSAFGMLGYFAMTRGYGLEFYRRLKANGAVQVEGPPDVVNQVAEGRYKVGVTLDNSARPAIAKGSPIRIAWPRPGAIAIYSPIAIFDATRNPAAAESLVNFVLTPEGQERIAETGWQPVRGDVKGSPTPKGVKQVTPDWQAIFGRQAELLEEYRSIFGG
jgi:iron(III) transport system substrate-binding protein